MRVARRFKSYLRYHADEAEEDKRTPHKGEVVTASVTIGILGL